MNDTEFMEEIFEIAFGDNAINKDYSKEEVLTKIREFSDIALIESETIQISSHDLQIMLDNGCGFYSVDVILENGQEVSIERGDVDDMLIFDEDKK